MDRSQAIQYFFYALLGTLAIHTIFHYKEIHWDTFVAIGTIALALFTWFLAKSETEESRKMRELMVEEYKKDRRRQRLTEQLKEFYSPLMSQISLFYTIEEIPDYKSYTKRKIDLILRGMLIPEKYHYLAEEKLRIAFQKYFDRGKTTMFKDKGNWLGLIKQIRDNVWSDFLALSHEYNKLTEKIEST